MTFSDKPQTRSLKTAVHSKFNSPFKSRRQAKFNEGRLITPSSVESECSTLVDFGVDYVMDEQTDHEDDLANDTFLHIDNSAWGRDVRSKKSRSGHSTTQDASRRSDGRMPAQMLDADEMAWNMSMRPKGSMPTRILHALAGQ